MNLSLVRDDEADVWYAQTFAELVDALDEGETRQADAVRIDAAGEGLVITAEGDSVQVRRLEAEE